MNFERIVLSLKSNTVLPPLLGRVCVGRWIGEADVKMCSEVKMLQQSFISVSTVFILFSILDPPLYTLWNIKTYSKAKQIHSTSFIVLGFPESQALPIICAI